MSTIALDGVVFVDAKYDPYDVGYLFFLDPKLSKKLQNPPNYGRYSKTIYPEDQDLGRYNFKCSLEGDESG